MNRCVGTISVGTKVDREMREFVENEADRLGVTPSEFLRRLLIEYRESRKGNRLCEHCEQQAVIELKYS